MSISATALTTVAPPTSTRTSGIQVSTSTAGRVVADQDRLAGHRPTGTLSQTGPANAWTIPSPFQSERASIRRSVNCGRFRSSGASSSWNAVR